MSCFFWITAQGQPGMAGCQPGQWTRSDQLPISGYQKGMAFYFPPDSAKEKDKWGMPGFVKDDTNYLPVNYNPNAMITYNTVAGGYYLLDTPGLWMDINTAHERHQILVFRLVLVDSMRSHKDLKQALYYSFPFDARERSMREANAHQPQTQIVPGVILWDDVMEARDQLIGKSFYALFPIKIGGGSLRYQSICIKGVGAGTYYAPVRIYYEVAGLDGLQHIDVVTSGNNVLPVYWPGRLFSDYFTSEDPKDTLPKGKQAISAARWDSICAGKVGLGMTSLETWLALGKAPNTKSTDSSTGDAEEWDYADIQIFLEKDKIIKIIRSSAKK